MVYIIELKDDIAAPSLVRCSLMKSIGNQRANYDEIGEKHP
jgi:hypothetical protein